jgi:hypothetical protein
MKLLVSKCIKFLSAILELLLRQGQTWRSYIPAPLRCERLKRSHRAMGIDKMQKFLISALYEDNDLASSHGLSAPLVIESWTWA